MESKLFAIDGKEIESVVLNDEVFNAKINKQVIYEYVKMYLGNQRFGTKNVKNRSEVKASTKKAYKQKGTGRSRHGAVSSGIFVKGGKVFGPKPKSYYKKIRKQLKEQSLIASLSDRAAKNAISIIEDFKLEKISTKKLNEIVRSVVPEGTMLLIVDEYTEANKVIYLSSRNLPYIQVKVISDFNAYDVIKHKNVLITKSAMDIININEDEVAE